jgi:hypothetical protein
VRQFKNGPEDEVGNIESLKTIEKKGIPGFLKEEKKIRKKIVIDQSELYDSLESPRRSMFLETIL